MEKRIEILTNRSFDLIAQIIQLCKNLDMQKKVSLSEPLLKSATEIGVNVYKINELYQYNNTLPILDKASGKAIETLYWLNQIGKTDTRDLDINSIITDCEDILDMLMMLNVHINK